MKKENTMRHLYGAVFASVATITALGAFPLHADEAEVTPAAEIPATMEEAVVETTPAVTEEAVAETTPEATTEETVAETTPEATTEEAPAVEATTEEVSTPEETATEEAVAPRDDVLIGYANEIIEAIKDKLEWKDVPVIMEMSAKMLGHFSNLTIDMKRESLISVLNYVIDHTDTPWLPDRMTDPFFKAMVPPFAHIFITDDFLAEIDFTVPAELVENKDFVGVAQMIKDRFSDGFRWNDLTFAIGAAFTFGEQLHDLSWEERGDVMNQLVDYVVDNTDTPWMPDSFSDPVFKAFAHSTIQIMVVSKKNEEIAKTDDAATAAQ